jgi:hypothetical protein
MPFGGVPTRLLWLPFAVRTLPWMATSVLSFDPPSGSERAVAEIDLIQLIGLRR